MRGLPPVVALVLLAWGHVSAADRSPEWPAFYPEGPVWIGDTLHWAEMHSDRVMRLGSDGPEPFLTEPGCGPTAIAPYGQGIVVLCHLSGALLHVDVTGQILARINRASDGTRLRNPNDASADGRGGVWFTDPGRFSSRAPAEGRLYYLDPAGTVRLHADGLAYGNGVFVDRTEGRLLLSEHLARRVLAYPLESENLGTPHVLIDLGALGLPASTYAEAGPDGLEIAPDGTLWVAEYGAGRLLAWRPDAGLVGVVEVRAPFVTNIAVGPEGRVAITGAFENRRTRNRGAVWLLPLAKLLEATSGGPAGSDTGAD